MELKKRCFECKELKPATDFNLNKRNKRMTRCKECLENAKATPRERSTLESERQCTACKEVKSVKEFYINRRRLPMTQCKTCYRKEFRVTLKVVERTRERWQS